MAYSPTDMPARTGCGGDEANHSATLMCPNTVLRVPHAWGAHSGDSVGFTPVALEVQIKRPLQKRTISLSY